MMIKNGNKLLKPVGESLLLKILNALLIKVVDTLVKLMLALLS